LSIFGFTASRSRGPPDLPHPLTYADFTGARIVAGVFHVLAWVVLFIGAVSAIEAGRTLHNNGATTNNEVAVVAGIIVGTIIAASTVAFFGYVLQLLTAIHYDVRFSDTWAAVQSQTPAQAPAMAPPASPHNQIWAPPADQRPT